MCVCASGVCQGKPEGRSAHELHQFADALPRSKTDANFEVDRKTKKFRVRCGKLLDPGSNPGVISQKRKESDS